MDAARTPTVLARGAVRHLVTTVWFLRQSIAILTIRTKGYDPLRRGRRPRARIKRGGNDRFEEGCVSVHSSCGCWPLGPAPPLPAGGKPFPAPAARLVVPFPPAGLVDTAARLLQPHLEKALGQPVIVDNRPTASGIVGTDAVAKAAPDG